MEVTLQSDTLLLHSNNQNPASPFCVSGVSQTACPETHTAAIDMGAQYGLTRKHTASHCGAAIHAASRMPVHKITMTRQRQRTALFCTSIPAHHNTHAHTHAHAPYSPLSGLNGFLGISAEHNAVIKKGLVKPRGKHTALRRLRPLQVAVRNTL